MAISAKEKKLIAGALLAGAVGVVFFLVMPAFDAVNATNASIASKETEITTQNATLKTKQQELSQKQANQELPEDINIRVFEADSFDKNVKLMLDTIIQAVTKSNNRLIKLEPTSKPGDITDSSTGTLSNPTPAAAPIDPNAPPGAAVDPNAPPATPSPEAGSPPAAASTGTDPNSGLPNVIGATTNSTGSLGNQIQYFAYSLTLRGTYDSLMDFIGDLSGNAELIEITSITMKNEVGPERVKGKDGGGADVVQIPGEEQEQEQTDEKALVDPAKPIRLTLKMKLLLIPKPGSSSSPSAVSSSSSSTAPPSAFPSGTP